MKLTKKRYIAAVSGGPDSMALLDKYCKHIIGVCHINYHKRVDSDYDTQIVKDYCAKHNIPLAICDVNKKVYAKAKQHNFQSLAREIRYEFFVKCGKKFKCDNLLIAHNLNDFIETAIMQENRKSLNFFYGIKPITQYKTLTIYRPLIEQWKKDLEQYCINHKVDYAIDSSNASDIYERNRIRKQLSKYSRKQLLDKYNKIVARNKKQALLEKKVNLIVNNWKRNNYSIDYFKTINDNYIDSVVYVFLKNNVINNINYNKIKLVRDYIVSKKSNNKLRLENNIKLSKHNRKVAIVNE